MDLQIPFKPFTILAIGPFAPVPGGHSSVKIIPVDTPKDALSLLQPSLWVPVPKELCPEGGLTIRPERLRDFSPDGMLESVPYLKDLDEARAFINKAASEGAAPGDIAEAFRQRWPHLPIDLSFEVRSKAPSRNAVDDILSMVATGGKPETPAAAAQGGPAAWKSGIDGIVAELMTTVFSDENFRTFEASWRGIEVLSKQGPAGPSKETHLAIVSASRENLGSTLDELAGALSADPPDLVLIDIPFDSSAASTELMERIAAFAEGLIAPTAISATPGFLGLHHWHELGRLPYLKHYVEDNAAFAKWNNLRSGDAGAWLVAACIGFLARSPYGRQLTPRGVFFEEPAPPWVSPVWALGTLAAMSTARFGWPSRFVDTGNIRLDGLGLHTTETGDQASTEAVVSVDRLRQFGEIGLTPLAGMAMKDTAFMPSARSISGEFLPFQMFFSRLTGFLIRLRETTGGSLPAGDAGPWLEESLGTFFRQAGGGVPGDLSVKASMQNDRPAFEITLTPPKTIVPDGRRATFSFAW